MHTTEVEKRTKRLSDLIAADPKDEASEKEAIKIGLELLGGMALNLARIADALEHGTIHVSDKVR